MEVMLNHARDATNAAMNAKQNIEHAQVDPPPPKKTTKCWPHGFNDSSNPHKSDSSSTVWKIQ